MRKRTRRWEPWKVEYISEREKFQAQQLYYNNLYHVFVRRYRPEGVPHDVIHLSIRNNDRSARHDWRDFQRIKNEIAGPQVEMVEMYPREDHKVDLSNQYHLWGFDTSEAVLSNVGLGFKEGRKVWNGLSARPAVPDTEKAVQRPNLEEDSTI